MNQVVELDRGPPAPLGDHGAAPRRGPADEGDVTTAAVAPDLHHRADHGGGEDDDRRGGQGQPGAQPAPGGRPLTAHRVEHPLQRGRRGSDGGLVERQGDPGQGRGDRHQPVDLGRAGWAGRDRLGDDRRLVAAQLPEQEGPEVLGAHRALVPHPSHPISSSASRSARSP